MKFRSTWLTPLLALCGVLSIGVDRASAQFVNGNFETSSLSGWGVVTGSQAVVSTDPPSVGNGTIEVNNGTNQAVLSAGTASSATIAAELTAGNSLGFTYTAAQFDALTSPRLVGDGAVIFQQVTTTGGTLSFEWAFGNSEGVGGTFQDTLFAIVDNTFFDLRDANVDASDTAYQTFNLSVSAGSHFVVVGVLNAGDSVADSQGAFDNFTVPAAVPEPTTWVLMASLAVAGLYRPASRRVKKLFVRC
jgi:hypothetical protein